MERKDKEGSQRKWEKRNKMSRRREENCMLSFILSIKFMWKKLKMHIIE